MPGSECNGIYQSLPLCHLVVCCQILARDSELPSMALHGSKLCHRLFSTPSSSSSML